MMRAVAIGLVLGCGVGIFWLWLSGGGELPGEVARPEQPRAAQPVISTLGEQVQPSVGREEIAADEEPADSDSSPGLVLRGRVVDAFGAPARSARVVVLGLETDAPHPEASPARADVDSSGAFAIEVPVEWRGTDVVLVARQSGSRPANKRLYAGDAAGAAYHVLRLEQGVELAGHVWLNGAPVPGASVDLDLRYMIAGVYFPAGVDHEAFWRDGRLEEKHASAKADNTGYFRARGLVPERYDVHVRLPGAYGMVLPALQFKAEAPDQAARFEVELAEIDVVARLHGRPTSARVSLASGTSAVRLEDRVRRRRFLLEPGAKAEIRVMHENCRMVTRSVVAPGARETLRVEVDLEPCERPELLVYVEGADAAGIERVGYAWRAAGGSLWQGWAESRGEDTFAARVPVDPGRWPLQLGSGQSGSAVWPRDVVLEVPASGVVETRHRLVSAEEVQELKLPGMSVLDGAIWHSALGLGGGK